MCDGTRSRKSGGLPALMYDPFVIPMDSLALIGENASNQTASLSMPSSTFDLYSSKKKKSIIFLTQLGRLKIIKKFVGKIEHFYDS